MFKVDIKADMKGLAGRFEELKKNLKDLTTTNRRIAFYLLQRTFKNFRDTVDPDGKKWPKLSKQRADGSDVPLNDTGQLRNSLKIEYSSSYAKIGTTLFYAQTHNLGRGGIKRRQFIPTTMTKRYERNIQDIIRLSLLSTGPDSERDFGLFMNREIGTIGSFPRGNPNKMKRAAGQRAKREKVAIKRRNDLARKAKNKENRLKRKERSDKVKLKRQTQLKKAAEQRMKRDTQKARRAETYKKQQEKWAKKRVVKDKLKAKKKAVEEKFKNKIAKDRERNLKEIRKKLAPQRKEMERRNKQLRRLGDKERKKNARTKATELRLKTRIQKQKDKRALNREKRRAAAGTTYTPRKSRAKKPVRKTKPKTED